MDSPLWFPEAIEKCANELADNDAPRVGVHVMSEFIYCPRAGIVTVDQQKEDTGCEAEVAPALGGLPTHDLNSIHKMLQALREQLAASCVLTGVSAAVVLLGFFAWGFPSLLLLIGTYYAAISLKGLLRDYDILRRRLKEAEVAAIKEPDWSLRIPQEIYWWSLVRAGFDIVQKQTAILDRDLHLAGKPWRVLQRGARHIPVIKFPTVIDPVDPRRHGQMSPQARARLAAYAYLTNRVERGQSDWVIVMFGNGFQGIAVPIDESMMSLFATGLQTARQQLEQYLADPTLTPDPARGASPCIRCPHGKPDRPEGPTVFRGVQVASYITQGADGKRYHCVCGDRFRWVPPHQDAKRLGLLPR